MRNLILAFALLAGLTAGGAVSFHHLIAPAAACADSPLLSPCTANPVISEPPITSLRIPTPADTERGNSG